MMKYFQTSYKHNKSNHDSTDNTHPRPHQYSTIHADKHKCKSHNTNDQVNEIIGQTHTPKTTMSELRIKTHMTLTAQIVTLTLL